MKPARWRKGVAVLALVGGAAWLGCRGGLDHVEQVPHLLGALAVMAVGYLLALGRKPFSARLIWVVAISIRSGLLWMPPGHDLYRYVWEGRVLAAGHNPYTQAPESMALSGLRDGGWARVEHPESTAIYPPLAEILFGVIAGLGGGVLTCKIVVLLADLGIGCLLARRFGSARALLYLWNPLVLYSFAGAGHYDSLFLLALVAGWLAWEAEPGNLRVAWWLGMAVALKWLAAPLLGWQAYDRWRRGERQGAMAAMFLGALPFLVGWLGICGWTHEWNVRLFPGTFVRYARSAECIPALVAALVPATQVLNEIYLAPIVLAWALILRRAKTFLGAAEWIFFWTFLLSPMLHAWYFIWLIPFAVASRNRGTVALSISGLVYYMVYLRYLLPDGVWQYTWLERGAIWLPFVIGFLWTPRGRLPASADPKQSEPMPTSANL